MNEFQKLSVYMHYWIAFRMLEISYKCSYGNYIVTFDQFCNNISTQTNTPIIDEWMWKYPETRLLIDKFK